MEDTPHNMENKTWVKYINIVSILIIHYRTESEEKCECFFVPLFFNEKYQNTAEQYH